MAVFYLMTAAGLVKDFSEVSLLIRSKKLPYPRVLLSFIILAWIIGSIGMLAPSTKSAAALLLVMLTVIVTLAIHDFWRAPRDRFVNEMQHFMKNVGLVGGLLAIAA